MKNNSETFSNELCEIFKNTSGDWFWTQQSASSQIDTKPFLGKQILKKLLSEASPITASCFCLTFTMKYNNTMVVIQNVIFVRRLATEIIDFVKR